MHEDERMAGSQNFPRFTKNVVVLHVSRNGGEPVMVELKGLEISGPDQPNVSIVDLPGEHLLAQI